MLHFKKSNTENIQSREGCSNQHTTAFVPQKSHAKTGRKLAVSRKKKFTCLLKDTNIMYGLYSCLFYDKTVKFRLKHDILSNE